MSVSDSLEPPRTERAESGRPGVVSLRHAVTAVWFVLVPGLLAGVCLRYLVPMPDVAPEAGIYGWLGRARVEQPVFLLLALFLTFALLIRYWATNLRTVRGVFVGDQRPAGPRSLVWFLGVVACAAGLGVTLRTFVVGSHRVVGNSMLPALEAGELLVVNRLAFRGQPGANAGLPRRGDVIVFRNDTLSEGPPALVKRVIGLPGDRVTLQNGRPVLNGALVPYCEVGPYFRSSEGKLLYGRLNLEFLDDAAYLTLDKTGVGTPDFEGFLVPEGQVFVLGDQRDDSIDSRTLARGRAAGLTLESLEGRVDGVLFGNPGNAGAPWTRLLGPLSPEVHLDGVDTRDLETKIASCLARRPARTQAPPHAQAFEHGEMGTTP